MSNLEESFRSSEELASAISDALDGHTFTAPELIMALSCIICDTLLQGAADDKGFIDVDYAKSLTDLFSEITLQFLNDFCQKSKNEIN